METEEEEDFNKLLANAKEQFSIPQAPAMPITSYAMLLKEGEGKPSAKTSARGNPQRQHQDKIAAAGYVSESYWAMVHTPIPLPKAMKIPKAREAVEAELQKLEKKPAWNLKGVQPRKKVQERAKREGKQSILEISWHCVMKHSEQEKSKRRYKGRIVFRGDEVRDEDGFYAVFSEQGTSASLMAVAKFLDAIARMPGNAGEDDDAIGAYTQIP